MDQLLPVRSIQLIGRPFDESLASQVEAVDVEATLQPYIGQGFFSLDIHRYLQRVLQATRLGRIGIE